MTSVLPPAALDPGRLGPAPADFQSHGVVVVLDALTLEVRHVSANASELLGGSVDQFFGQRLGAIFGEHDAALIDGGLSERLGELGWQRVKLRDGRTVKVHAFDAGVGHVGLDIIPTPAAVRSYGAQAVERVAQWSERILGAATSAELLELACDTVTHLTGFSGAWAVRIEREGYTVVLAADAEDVEDVVGDHVPASDTPPGQPYLRGRPIPFFVADIAAPPIALTPQPAADAQFETSTLRRPFAEYLDRLSSLGVRATLSIPIVVDGELWGQVIAHHPQAREVSPAVQAELRLLSIAMSSHLAELIELQDTRERLEHAMWSTRILEAVSATKDLRAGLAVDPVALLGLCGADAAILAIDEQTSGVGPEITDDQRAHILAVARAQLGAEHREPVVASNTIPGLPHRDADAWTPGGFLAVRLGNEPTDLIVWLRPESRQAVTWVQHHEGAAVEDVLFTEMQKRVEERAGSCAAWTPAQLRAVTDFRVALASFLLGRYQHVQQLNAALARSNDEFDAFAYAAAHDLKQPIRGIRQYTEFFIEDYGEQLDDDAHDQLATVVRLADRMSRLLDDLLTYAELDGATWETRTLDLRAAVDQAVELLPPQAVQEADIDAQDGVTLTADPVALQQLLLNLIGNALKHSGEGRPYIRVGVTSLEAASLEAAPPATLSDAPNSTPVLFVADHGVGIDERFHDHVFELFRKIPGGAPETESGSGAGLALCRRIARRHRGDIWLKSAPAEGATFFIALPA